MRTIDTNKLKHDIAEVPIEKRSTSHVKYSREVLEAMEELGSREDYMDARSYAYAHGFNGGGY